jgi:hypothetical protein
LKHCLLLKLILMQPQLLLGHVKNYLVLMREGVQEAYFAWRLRFLLYALSGSFLMLGLVCAAVALLLWGGLPVLHPERAWILVGLPLGLVLVSVFCYVAAYRCKVNNVWDDLSEQIQLDRVAIEQAFDK